MKIVINLKLIRSYGVIAATVVIVLAVGMFFIGWNVGRSHYNELQADYDKISSSLESLKHDFSELEIKYSNLLVEYENVQDVIYNLTSDYAKLQAPNGEESTEVQRQFDKELGVGHSYLSQVNNGK